MAVYAGYSENVDYNVGRVIDMIREGAAGLGAVGFAVGQFAPPLLAVTAVGAAIGAGQGRDRRRLREDGQERNLTARRGDDAAGGWVSQVRV